MCKNLNEHISVLMQDVAEIKRPRSIIGEKPLHRNYPHLGVSKKLS